MKSKISFEGALIGLAKVERSGKYPPNLILFSLMYFISGLLYQAGAETDSGAG